MPEPLAMPPTVIVPSGASIDDRARLWKRIGRHDRARRGVAAVGRPSAAAAAATPARTFVDVERHANHAGGRDEHLIGAAAHAPAAAAAAISRATSMPGLARARVRAAAVDDDRAQRARPIARECSRETTTGAATALLVVNTAAAGTGPSATIERQVERRGQRRVAALDAARDAGRAETRRRRDATIDRRSWITSGDPCDGDAADRWPAPITRDVAERQHHRVLLAACGTAGSRRSPSRSSPAARGAARSRSPAARRSARRA